MNKVIALTFLLIFSSAQAAVANTRVVTSLSEETALIDAATVVDSIVLGNNAADDITVRLISTDLGSHTDVAPNKNLYITFLDRGELNTTRTAFLLDTVIELKSAKRISAGVYEIAVKDANLRDSKLVVDTTQVFVDNKKLKLEEGQDSFFASSIKVTEK